VQQFRQGVAFAFVVPQFPQFADACFVLTTFLRHWVGQLVHAYACVGVDVGDGLVFLRHVLANLHEGHVLEHIGVVACVKGVAVAEHGVFQK